MRYILMQDSEQKNTDYDTYYKDCLTVNFDNVELLFNPVQYELTSVDIDRLDLFMYKVYGDFKYLDIFLELNNIEHRSILQAGDIILIPSKEELDSFIQKRRLS